MGMFWAIGAALTVLALVLVIAPLLFGAGRPGPARGTLNRAVYRERLAELQAERDRGALSTDDYARAREELERSALQDLEQDEPGVRTRRGHWLGAALLVVALPAGVFFLYSFLGRAELLSGPIAPENLRPADHDQLGLVVNQLVDHLRDQPGDVRGWALLGRSYLALERYDDARLAYGRAARLAPRDPDVLVDYAEAAALAAGETLEGMPRQLLERALSLAPDHQKGLWLSGIAAYRAGEYERAIQHWEHLLALVPADGRRARLVERNLAQARAQQQGDAAQAAVTVNVSLDPKLAARAAPEARVFVAARATNGPAMPLAVDTLQVRDLPASVTLTDRQAMAPNARLSNHRRVDVVARVSRAGTAQRQSGDLEGRAEGVDVDGASVSIEINQVVP